MSTDFSPAVGFQPSCRERSRKRRGIAFTQLLLTLSLALSIAVALTAVSIGMARAHALGSMITDDNGSLGVVLLFGGVLALMGLITACVTRMVDVHPRT